jgi:hypothetical protein
MKRPTGSGGAEPDKPSTDGKPLLRYGPGVKMGGMWGALPLAEYIATLPDKPKEGKPFENRVIVTRPQGGVRLMRLYKPTKPHYHTKSDAIIYVLSGKGK